MAIQPPNLRTEIFPDLTERTSIHMQDKDTPESIFGVREKQTGYLHFEQADTRILHLPALPKCVEQVLGFNTVSQTLHIESQDLSEALVSRGGVKRALGSDGNITTSGYESEDEDGEDVQTSTRKKQRKKHNKVEYKKRERIRDTRRRGLKQQNSRSTGSYQQHRFNKCNVESSQNSPTSSESSSSCSSSGSSESDRSSESDSSDACSSDESCSCSSESSDDNSMDTSSDSDSLGLSLSSSSSSADSSSDDDVSDTPWKRLIPRVIPCSKSCVCKTGSSSPPTPIARRGGVATPLYKRLLTRRLLSTYNVSKYDCCDQSCNVYWLHND